MPCTARTGQKLCGQPCDGPLRRSLTTVTLVIFALISPGDVRADDWPQWLGPQRDGVWREQGIVAQFPEGGPAVRWRAPIGSGYSGPAVAGRRVFAMDFQRAKDE